MSEEIIKYVLSGNNTVETAKKFNLSPTSIRHKVLLHIKRTEPELYEKYSNKHNNMYGRNDLLPRLIDFRPHFNDMLLKIKVSPMQKPTNELIEKVARVLFETEYPSMFWNDYKEHYQGEIQARFKRLAKAALSVIPDSGEWQPMDSSPKDGTEILVISLGCLSIVRWHEGYNTGWIGMVDGASASDSRDGYIYVSPDAWMPLPLPPTNAESEEK